MNGTRWYASPLFGTAGVIAGLALIAIPLRHLTAARPVELVVRPETQEKQGKTPAVLRLKLLDPVSRLRIETVDGEAVLESAAMPAGESEHDVQLPLHGGMADLRVSLAAGDAETAVFLTLMPDGHQDRTLYLTGAGTLEETLHYEWNSH